MHIHTCAERSIQAGSLTLLCTLWMRCKCAAHLAAAGSCCDQSVFRDMTALLTVKICSEKYHCRWRHGYFNYIVCVHVCVCARACTHRLADACVHMWMCCIFYSVQCQYFAGLHSSISLCVSLQYSICGFECVFICSQAKEWLQAANDISNRQVDLIETSFLTAAARVLRGSATCCLHYKPLDHQAYHAGLCVSVFNNVSDSSECSILAPLTYFVVLHCKFIQVWKVVQNISGRRQILATS